MLTGLRRATGAVKRVAAISRSYGKVLESKIRDVGDEYKAVRDLGKERASMVRYRLMKRRAYSKKSWLLGEVWLKDSLRMNILSTKFMKDVEDYMEVDNY